MRTCLKGALMGLAALGAAAAAPAAWAGCGTPPNLAPADWTGSSAGLFTPVVNNGQSSIVGLWSIKMTVNGGPFDFGYAQWHSDGTEMMLSGGRIPATGDVCLGVWAQTGPFSYHLSHFGLSFTAAGVPDGDDHIVEDVTIGQKGDSFTGSFSIDRTDPNTGAHVAHIAGSITGLRVTP
jgi:hypothetical protein